MHLVLRAVVAYLFILFLFRISAKRSITDCSPFELILILFLGGVAGPGMLAGEQSLTGSMIVVSTLVGLHTLVNWIKMKHEPVSRLVEGTPIILVEDGKLIAKHMKKCLFSENDILTFARDRQLTSIDRIRYAVLERNGRVSIVPKRDDAT